MLRFERIVLWIFRIYYALFCAFRLRFLSAILLKELFSKREYLVLTEFLF